MHSSSFRSAILALLLAFAHCVATAEGRACAVQRDTLTYTYTPITEQVTLPKRGFARFLSHYGYAAPQSSASQGFDYSFTLAPSYSRATNLGLGAAAVGYYGAGRLSTVSLGATATLSGAYSVTISGRHTFKNAKHRIDYALALYALPTDFWGIGYTAGYGAVAQRCKESAERATVGYYYSPVQGLTFGTTMGFEHVEYSLAVPQLNSLSATKLALAVQYDTRDNKSSATKGFYTALSLFLRPKGWGSISTTAMGLKASVRGYCKLWRGSVLAAEALCELNSASTPWLLYSQAGDSNRMRGYYAGRFRDRNMVFAQVELRQSIWRGLGLGLWGGAGNWFGEERFTWSHTLPTYGVGLRFAASERVTLRLDYGFGRRVSDGRIGGFVFAVSDSF